MYYDYMFNRDMLNVPKHLTKEQVILSEKTLSHVVDNTICEVTLKDLCDYTDKPNVQLVELNGIAEYNRLLMRGGHKYGSLCTLNYEYPGDLFNMVYNNKPIEDSLKFMRNKLGDNFIFKTISSKIVSIYDDEIYDKWKTFNCELRHNIELSLNFLDLE